MKFGNLSYLNLFWLIPVLVIFYIYSFRKKRLVVQKFAKLDTYSRLIPQRSSFKAFLKVFLVLFAFSLIIFSLTAPKWGYSWEDVKRKGIDIVIAVDVSRSMLARDIKPNRLERAKREIIDLINMLQGDRIALVAFAGVSFLECPLTLDYSAASLFLDSIDAELIPVQGTNISSAIQTAIKAFDEEKKTSKAIILITDGEDHDDKAIDMAKKARSLGVKIYTIGVGALEGAPIPDEGGGFKKTEDGKVVVSKLNEKILKDIAIESAGAYVRSVSGDMDLEKIYMKEIKTTMQGVDIKTSKRKRWEERYQIFLFFAWLFLFMEIFITTRQGVLRKVFKIGMFGLMLLYPSLGQALQLNSKPIQGIDLYNDAKYKESLKLFNESIVEEPENPKWHYNAGLNYYQLKDYQKAIDSFNLAAQKGGKKLQERADFSIGNSYYNMGKLEEAVKSYKEVLALNPNNEAAKKNLALALKEIKRRMNDKKDTEKRAKNQQQQKQQQQQNQQNKQGKQQQKDQQQGQASKSKQEKESKDQKEKDQTGKSDKNKEKEGEKNKESALGEKGEDKQKQAKPQKYVPYKMSEDEAKKWLKSLNEKDSKKKYRMQEVPGGAYSNEKDW